MPKILVGECKQEVSTFNPVISTYEDFDISVGKTIIDFHRNVGSEMAGALSVFNQQGDVEIVPTYSARAITSAGPLAAESFARMGREFLETVRNAPPVDAVYLSLHGAMQAIGEDDPEGWLLAEIRKIVGEQIPIVASFDLHGILTQRILQHCDAIVAYHTYPHTDFYSTGERAATLLMRILRGEAKPVTARVYIPALVRGPELITATGLWGKSIRHAQALEAAPQGLSAGMFIGNPFTDVIDLASNSFVVANGEENLGWAKQEALKIAQDFWAMRKQLHQPLITLDEAIATAKATLGEGTSMFVDAADATSSGASGDSNEILRGVIEQGYTGRTLVPIVDPPAVEAAFNAGIGAEIQVVLGGQLDKRFKPLFVKARVKMLSDGDFINESHGSVWHSGNSAVLEVGNVTVVATSRAVSLYDRSLFYAHGQDPKNFDAVVVKSPRCQPHMFDDWARNVLDIDVDGSTSANLQRLGHTRCRRPIFPLDEGVELKGEVEVYVR